jgi:hypothetical protein
MSQSQEKTASEARLGFALQAARDAAINLGEGNDVAAVFTFEMGGPLRIVPCQVAGTLMTVNTNPAALPVTMEVFVPMSAIEPISLPTGWTVRAWTPGATINNGWYNDGATPRYAANAPAWVFPETGFFDHTTTTDGANRQTFMVRFEGGTGKLVGTSTKASLVLLPRPSSLGRTAPDYLRADLSADLRQLVQTYLRDPRAANLSAAVRNEVLSTVSSDCVMAKSVRVLALTEESALAGLLGVRVDDTTRCLYTVPASDVTNGMALKPRLVNGPTGNNPLDTVSVGRAIEYYDNPTNTGTVRTQAGEARIYAVDRYSGSLKEMTVAAP